MAVDGVLPHLHARDVTLLFVSQAPLEKLQAYKRRWAGAFPGSRPRAATSTSTSASRHAGAGPRGRRAASTRAGLPPIVEQNARSGGTDIAGYLSESTGVQHLRAQRRHRLPRPTRRPGAAWSFSWATTRSSTAHPKGRDEGEAWQPGSAATTSTTASDAMSERSRGTTMVVGASHGLGRGIATAFAEAGAPVVAVSRTAAAFAEPSNGAGAIPRASWGLPPPLAAVLRGPSRRAGGPPPGPLGGGISRATRGPRVVQPGRPPARMTRPVFGP